MAKGTYISINTSKIGTVSASASSLGRQMEATRTELKNDQSRLSEHQNILEKYYKICWNSVIPTDRLKDQQEKMEEVVSLLAQADQLAKDANNKLDTKISALKLAVAAMGGLMAAAYTTAISVISGVISGETDCGDDWVDVGNWKTTSYTNSSKNWADKKGKVQDYSDFSVVAGFKEEYVLKQRDYHNGEIACTATSDAIAGSIANGKKLTPGKSYWKGNSCVWPNTEIIAGSKYFTVERQCQEIFKQIKEGIPVILRVPGHSVIAVGIRDGVDGNSVTPDDILIVDL